MKEVICCFQDGYLFWRLKLSCLKNKTNINKVIDSVMLFEKIFGRYDAVQLKHGSRKRGKCWRGQISFSSENAQQEKAGALILLVLTYLSGPWAQPRLQTAAGCLDRGESLGQGETQEADGPFLLLPTSTANMIFTSQTLPWLRLVDCASCNQSAGVTLHCLDNLLSPHPPQAAISAVTISWNCLQAHPE